MNLNYLAFFLIAFVPLITAFLWYRPNTPWVKWSGIQLKNTASIKQPLKLVWAFILSFTLVYGYINLVIHQMGFYELFFTDIMQGNETSKKVVEDFLTQYGQKHRHFGHGFFHGVINAFVFALPFVSFHAFVDNKNTRFVIVHFLYWLITSALVCGLISAFV